MQAVVSVRKGAMFLVDGKSFEQQLASSGQGAGLSLDTRYMQQLASEFVHAALALDPGKAFFDAVTQEIQEETQDTCLPGMLALMKAKHELYHISCTCISNKPFPELERRGRGIENKWLPGGRLPLRRNACFLEA